MLFFRWLGLQCCWFIAEQKLDTCSRGCIAAVFIAEQKLDTGSREWLPVMRCGNVGPSGSSLRLGEAHYYSTFHDILGKRESFDDGPCWNFREDSPSQHLISLSQSPASRGIVYCKLSLARLASLNFRIYAVQQ